MLNFIGNLAYNFLPILQEQMSQNQEEEKILELEDVLTQEQMYNKIIPVVYGEFMLAGNVIWHSDLRVNTVETGSGSKGWAKVEKIFGYVLKDGLGTNFGYSSEKKTEYRMDFAIGICEGPVDEILHVYANGELINSRSIIENNGHIIETSRYKFRLYKGGEEQMPDALIQREYGNMTPAFRGLCYGVFEDFPLHDFGNKLPNFTFLVRRQNGLLGVTEELTVGGLVRGVNLIPGCGEVAYDTKIVTRESAVHYTVGPSVVTMPSGDVRFANNTTAKGRADSLVSLDYMKSELPSVQWISLVSSWFASGLDAKTAQIYPAVEERHLYTKPYEWTVAGETRKTARVIGRDGNGKPLYGGTPSDSSILDILEETRKRGYKTCFYPMLFVEAQGKPWRGRITGRAEDLPRFFERYERFILHYARLLAGKCDAFVVGSEMIGLTRVRAADGSFPAVLFFSEMIDKVREIMGKNVILTYAADWSEYHHTDGGFYNMDALWANKNLDVIGIDAYFPLTSGSISPTIKEIEQGWESGEGWSYYIDEKGIRQPLEPKYAWKNIRWFLANEHINPDGKKTLWVPGSKRVWFTEYGFPSVDLCTNQPNVFYDETSSESSFPRGSKGRQDFLSQKNAIVATEIFLRKNSDIIENAFVWCYDLRPFPYFPNFRDVWSDGAMWRRGHWLNGKIGSASFSKIVADVCVRAGILAEELEFVGEDVQIDGFAITTDKTARSIVETLCGISFCLLVSGEKGLKFISMLQTKPAERDILTKDILVNEKNTTLRAREGSFKGGVASCKVFFMEKTQSYKQSNVSYSINIGDVRVSKLRANFVLPCVMEESYAAFLCKLFVKFANQAGFKAELTLPFRYSDLRVGEIVRLEGVGEVILEKMMIDENFNVKVTAGNFTRVVEVLPDSAIGVLEGEAEVSKRPELLAFNLPNIYGVEVPFGKQGIFCGVKNFSKGLSVIFEGEDIMRLTSGIKTAKIIAGELLEGCGDLLEDRASELQVLCPGFRLFSVDEKGFYGNQNLALVRGELVAFKTAEKKEENIYVLRGFLRRIMGVTQVKTEEEFVLVEPSQILFLPKYSVGSEITLELRYGENPIHKITTPFTGAFLQSFIEPGRSYSLEEEGAVLSWSLHALTPMRNFGEEEDYPRYSKVKIGNHTFKCDENRLLITHAKLAELGLSDFDLIEFSVMPYWG